MHGIRDGFPNAMIQQNSIFTSCTDMSSCAGTQAVHLPAFYLFLPLQGVRPEDGKIGTNDQGGQRHAWEYGTLGKVGLQAYQPVFPHLQKHSPDRCIIWLFDAFMRLLEPQCLDDAFRHPWLTGRRSPQGDKQRSNHLRFGHSIQIC